MDKVKVLYDYVAEEEKELSLQTNEIITVIKREESGWAEGINSQGKKGWFSLAFVEDYVDIKPLPKPLPQTPPPKPQSPRAPQLQPQTPQSPQTPQTPPQVNTPPMSPEMGSPSEIRLRSSGKEKKSKRPISSRLFSKEKQLNTRSTAITHNSYDLPPVEDRKKSVGYLGKWKHGGKLKNEMGTPEKEDPTIYGLPLETVIEKYGGPIPPLIVQCVELLRKTSLTEEGIFRVSGTASQVIRIGEVFHDLGAKPDLSAIDCHAVSGSLKKFLRDLPDPLFPVEFHLEFKAASDIYETDERSAQFKAILSKIPKNIFIIIQYLIEFLHEVSTHSAVNMMQTSNLGIVFGPTLLRGKEEQATGFTDPMSNTPMVVTQLIEDYDLIFDKSELHIPAEREVEKKVETVVQKVQLPPTPPPRKNLQNSVDNSFVPKFKPPPFKPRVLSSPALPIKQAENKSPVNPSTPPIPLRSEQVQPNPVQISTPPAVSQPATPPSNSPSGGSRRVAPARRSVVLSTQTPLKTNPQTEYAIGAYDFDGDFTVGQMSFSAGSVIKIVSKHQSGWWTGILDGKKGLIPVNFLYTKS